MTAPYEAELRVRVPRIDSLRARLAALGARTAETYACTDHYYQPASLRWPPQQQTLRKGRRCDRAAPLPSAARGTPLFALVEEDAPLSVLVEGDDRITLIRYRTEADAVRSLLHAPTLTSHAGGSRTTDAAR